MFELNSTKRFIAGIRHAGGNPELPFVSVTTGFRGINSSDLSSIATIIKSDFRLFGPRHFAIWAKDESVPAGQVAKVSVARRYLAGRIKALDLTVGGTNILEVRPMMDESYFPWYEQQYNEFHSSNPNLKSWVTISGKKDLERYRSQHLLFGAYVGDRVCWHDRRRKRTPTRSFSVYIGELLISRKYKGQGLAAQMQRLFLKEVGESFEVVWGTIDARNVPSTKTALRVGPKADANGVLYPARMTLVIDVKVDRGGAFGRSVSSLENGRKPRCRPAPQ